MARNGRSYKDTTCYKIFDNFMIVMIRILAYGIAGSLLLVPVLFTYLNLVQWHHYIDEKFHVPQTLRYCRGEFSEWDPKITTLPGLYLLAALFLGYFDRCTITYLRFINVFCTYMNLALALEIVHVLIGRRRDKNSDSKLLNYKLFLTAWNIAFFPPLFFWFFLFYTDVFSVFLILSMLYLYVNSWNKCSTLMGLLSLCVRQTNIIWVGFLGMEKTLNMIEDVTKKPNYTDTLNLIPCIRTFFNLFRARAKQGIKPFFNFLFQILSPIFSYILVLILFITFVIVNEGIVVGDKTAHVPTIHFTQVFYFSTFVLVFSWPLLIPYLYSFFKFTCKHFILMILFLTFITLVVHFNTLVHPYVLADNRHYTFYIWKNFMNRYFYFKYLLIPLYAFAIFAILQSINHLRLLSIVAYVSCVCIVLVPQLLLEPRYFILPYIFFRFHQKESSNWQIVAETLTNIIINGAQFLLFINKTFDWEDEEYPQRIAW